MCNEIAVQTLRQDLASTGAVVVDENYLQTLLSGAKSHLERQGIYDDGSDDYLLTLTGTAAWIYRKRVTGEAEPNYLKRARIELSLARGKVDGRV